MSFLNFTWYYTILISGKIGFLDIVRVVEHTLETAPNGKLENLDDVGEADAAARRIARSFISDDPARH